MLENKHCSLKIVKQNESILDAIFLLMHYNYVEFSWLLQIELYTVLRLNIIIMLRSILFSNALLTHVSHTVICQ